MGRGTEDSIGGGDERRTAPIVDDAAPPSRVRLGVGSLVAGKYRLERVLGRGGMGIVFAARHLRLDDVVAIKVLSTISAEAVTRMMREARLAVGIKNPHVGRVLDIGTDGGAPFVVMEHLEGRTLAALLRDGAPLSVRDAVRYAIEACEGLSAAHAKGIVHRDLKPSNLFLAESSDGSRVVKVLDFGIAKDLAATSSDVEAGALTASTAVLGSPFYMAPEQVRSAKDVDARADVWSMGVTLFELLTAELPFVAGTTPGILAAVVADRPRSVRDLRPDVPSALESVLTRCLEKDPRARFESARALAVALEPFLTTGRRVRTSSALVFGGVAFVALAGGAIALGTRHAAPTSADVTELPIERESASSHPLHAPPASATAPEPPPLAAPPTPTAAIASASAAQRLAPRITSSAPRVVSAASLAPSLPAPSSVSPGSSRPSDVVRATADRH